MLCYGAKDFARAFRTVRKNTIQTAQEIPEEQYGFRAAPDTRSVAELLIHIAVTPTLTERIQFTERRTDFDGFDYFGAVGAIYAEEKKPLTKAEILELLTLNGDHFAALLDGMTDEFLSESVIYPAGMEPPSKTRFEMLMSTKEHEMHHRGQLMLIQRMLGATTHLTRHMQEIIASMQAQQQAQQ